MGARELDPYDFDAAVHTYEVIRQTYDDVATIARHTGMRESRIVRIKVHLFYRTHHLDVATQKHNGVCSQTSHLLSSDYVRISLLSCSYSPRMCSHLGENNSQTSVSAHNN